MKKIFLLIFFVFFLFEFNKLYAQAAQLQPQSLTKGSELPLKVLKQPFIINEFEGDYGTGQWRPRVAADSSGHFGVVWVDERNAEAHIYAQVFKANGERVGKNIKISDQPLTWNSEPDVAASRTGHFVVCWAPTYYKIKVRMFDIYGKKSNLDITIQDSHTGDWVGNPSVAMANDGSFLVVFDQSGDIYADDLIHGYLFSPDGKLQKYVQINEPYLKGWLGANKTVACDSAGNFVVTFTGFKDSQKHIFLQVLDHQGNQIGHNKRVSLDNDRDGNYFSTISSLSNGTFLISWIKRRFRIFKVDSGFVTSPISIIDSLNIDQYNNEVICSSDGKNIFFLMSPGVYSPSYLFSVNKFGKLITQPVVLKDSSGNPVTGDIYSLANFVGGRLSCVYKKYYRSDPDVIWQTISKDFSEMSPLIKASDDTSHGNQFNPRIAVNNLQQVLIVWEDKRNGKTDYYCQLLDSLGNTIGENIRITGDEEMCKNAPVVAALSDGSFVVAYTVYEKYRKYRIRLKKILSDATLMKGRLELPFTYYSSPPELQIFSGNEEYFILFINNKSWQTVRLEYVLIYNGLSTQAKLITLIEDSDSLKIKSVNVAADSNLNILTVWSDEENSLWGQITDYSGNSIQPRFLISNSVLNYNPEIAVSIYNPEEFAIIFPTINSRYKVERFYNFGKNNQSIITNTLFNSAYLSKDQNFQIIFFANRKLLVISRSGNELKALWYNDAINDVERFALHTLPNIKFSKFSFELSPYMFDAAVVGKRLFLTYATNDHENTGLDIWGKVFSLAPINLQKEYIWDVQSLSEQFRMFFPNPFNETTKLEYLLPVSEWIKITVFDVRGRKVDVLFDGFQEKGIHSITFDARRLPSGIYFIRFTGFQQKTFKVVHVR